ncbi:DUF3667 domain-containing protein [Chitinophaga sp.]|uniref:DUF3667 domain-containing protein n=1 Tax=Chitinophaga sp. TaxID=1869181 RepID=UPI00261E25F5|nr:DUF3667 domain-containing protein [uncultured Chitinophaga sp.]
MKTQHLRQDKTCLNCGHEVPERFCTHCGQENVDTKESFGHLVSHFFQDITHYDSKLLLTLKYLFFYPGRLTREYIAGKRMTFVNPIRLYVFTSFVFFLLAAITAGNHHDPYARESEKDVAKQQATFGSMRNTAERIRERVAEGRIAPEDTIKALSGANVLDLIAADSIANSAHVYDSLQQTLPPDQQDSWLQRKALIRLLEMRDKYGPNMGYVLQEKFFHNYPKLFFLLLPFFALLLKWFYYRREDMVYGDHAIFSIHMHTLVFMIGILAMLIGMPFHGFSYYGWVALLVFLYLVMSIRNAYGVSSGSALGTAIGVVLGYAVGTLIVLILFTLLIFVFT